MAGRGRGRGRDMSSGASSQRVAKGGQSSGKPKIPRDIEGLGTYLFSLNESNYQQFGSTFAEIVVGYCSSKDRLQEAVDLIYDTTTSDRDSANLGAMICEGIINYESNEASAQAPIQADFRKYLLARFQTDFKQKDALRSNSIESWLGVLAFLCQIYNKIRVNNQPILVMGKAILSSIESIIQKPDVIDDEIDCICTHVKHCGGLLEANYRDQFEAIFLSLKRLILKRDSSCMVRCVVLELIEYRHMGWKDPDKTLDKFYVDALADAVAEDELGVSA